MATQNQITQTPNGFQCVSPWSSIDKTMMIDLKVYLASKRNTRNILSSRNGVKGQSNVYQDGGVILPRRESGPVTEYVYTHPPANSATILVSNRPVRIKITNVNGQLDLGMMPTFVMLGPLVSIYLANEENLYDAELNLIVI